MVKRYAGGVISASKPSVTQSSSSGLFSATEAAQYNQSGTWVSRPGAPTSVTAVGGNAQTSVSFSAPASNGGSAIISYTVISSPGNITASGSSSPITVTGLTNETSYTFTVIAVNALGPGVASSASNAVVPSLNPLVDYLVVAGGGGGGGAVGGGGGAGGFRTGSGLSATVGVTYTVTVGSGGSGGGGNNKGSTGGNSVFSSITSNGGGGGAGYSVGNADAGGSGGGAGGFGTTRGLGNTPSTSPSQGNDGGIDNGAGFDTGGGGGASAAGGAGGPAGGGAGVSGNGGAGTSSSITGTSVAYAGGGGGGGRSDGGISAGTGGTGGGGNGSRTTNGTAGTTNTGGGGGGGAYVGSFLNGGAGGSGIVIIRYADVYSAATTTGSPTYTVSGGYRIYQFTGNGSITF